MGRDLIRWYGGRLWEALDAEVSVTVTNERARVNAGKEGYVQLHTAGLAAGNEK
jgi:hypothetical protein